MLSRKVVEVFTELKTLVIMVTMLLALIACIYLAIDITHDERDNPLKGKSEKIAGYISIVSICLMIVGIIVWLYYRTRE
jgi:uncharacterized membrane protein